MERTRLQPGQIQLAQPFSDGPFGNLDGETAGDLRAQINAAPADHAVFLRIGPLQNQGFQFGQLRASQRGWLARAMARLQARNPCRIVAVHPVAQRLTIHPGSCRRFAPGATLQNERQGKQAANLRAITAFRCEHAKRVRRVLSAGKGERLAHAILPWPQRGLRGVNRRGGAIPSPSESQRVKVSDGWYYQVTNWPEYDRALQQRGSLTVWVTPEALAAWHPPKTGRRGRSPQYADLAIETGHLLRLAFGRPWRQTEGLLRSFATLLGLDIGIPDHTTFSRRSPGLALASALAQAQRTGPVHVVIDATGLKVYGAGEWLTEKHGERGRRTWRKLHLAVDPESGEILAVRADDH